MSASADLKFGLPSDAVRKRFHGKPEDWAAFCAACDAELEQAAGETAVKALLDRLRSVPVSLLCVARDEDRNNASASNVCFERQIKGAT
jgi:uncharacterized protein YeaO (DUF488 family)